MLIARRAAIFEDDFLISEVLRDALDLLGFEVVAAVPTLSEALHVVSDAGLDVAIVDMDLRGASAYAVLDELRRRAIPYVIATGGGQAAVEEPYSEAPIILKPYSVHSIRAGIERAFLRAHN